MLTITAEFYDNLSGWSCNRMWVFNSPRGQGLALVLGLLKGNNVKSFSRTQLKWLKTSAKVARNKASNISINKAAFVRILAKLESFYRFDGIWKLLLEMAINSGSNVVWAIPEFIAFPIKCLRFLCSGSKVNGLGVKCFPSQRINLLWLTARLAKFCLRTSSPTVIEHVLNISIRRDWRDAFMLKWKNRNILTSSY